MTFEDYAAEYREQDVWLLQSIVAAGENNVSSLQFTVEPDGFYSAVAEAGYELRKWPTLKLADNVMKELPDENRVVQRVLREIINASIEPARENTADLTFFCGTVRDLSTCADAENDFATVVRQMENPHAPLMTKGNPTFIGYQILRNTEGKALGIRKGINVASTLTLEHSVINDIPYPPGSLLRVENSGSKHDIKPPCVPSGVQGELCIEDVTRAGFLRLSAFAVPPDERKTDFIPKIVDRYTRVEDIPVLTTYTIADMRAIAQQALDAGLTSAVKTN